ncbi:hypothetical protein QSU92_09705 [Microbacterium sp. ET2]|nr:hypothetical protein [Microbacterium sp. ET2 (Ac-2212)]WJL94273.1 hypothetical protein QSU92_09705 [Microbacterium sp. ET2 (Ac-2212)]
MRGQTDGRHSLALEVGEVGDAGISGGDGQRAVVILLDLTLDGRDRTDRDAVRVRGHHMHDGGEAHIVGAAGESRDDGGDIGLRGDLELEPVLFEDPLLDAVVQRGELGGGVDRHCQLRLLRRAAVGLVCAARLPCGCRASGQGEDGEGRGGDAGYRAAG